VNDTVSNRLYPWLSQNGEHAVSGDTDIVVDALLVSANGGGAKWDGDTRIYYGLHIGQGLMTWAFGDAEPKPVDGPTWIGGNEIAASGGRHAIGRPDRGVMLDDGRTLHNYRNPTISDDGRWLACLNAANQALSLVDLTAEMLAPQLIDPRPCAQPRFGGTTLAWECEAQIYGIGDVGNPDLIARAMAQGGDRLSVPGLRHFKPCPIWIPELGILLVASHTDDSLIVSHWASVMGWVIHRGVIDQGYYHARPRGKDVRLLYTVDGALKDYALFVAGSIDLRPQAPQPNPDPLPDMPFVVDPHGVVEDVWPWLVTGCTAVSPDGSTVWMHKVPDDPTWGEHWDRDAALVGHLADNSGSGPYYLDGPRLWMPRRCVSGYSQSYVTEYRWADGLHTTVPVTIRVDVGYGRYNGVEVRVRQIYDPRSPDPHNSKRMMGYQERNYLNAQGLIRFERYHDDTDGNTLLEPAMTAQPWPVVKDGIYVEPRRPKPYGPILPTPPEKPMSLTGQQVAQLLHAWPWDVDVDHMEHFRENVWKRDQGGDVPSRGALAYYHREVAAAVVDFFNQLGRLPPANIPAQYAAEWNQAFDRGTAAAIAAYRREIQPDPEDNPNPQ
jgi:hypothetical protein